VSPRKASAEKWCSMSPASRPPATISPNDANLRKLAMDAHRNPRNVVVCIRTSPSEERRMFDEPLRRPRAHERLRLRGRDRTC
jgi:hypothetical protein